MAKRTKKIHTTIMPLQSRALAILIMGKKKRKQVLTTIMPLPSRALAMQIMGEKKNKHKYSRG